MDMITKGKWDRAAKSFDYMAGIGAEKRWAPKKRELFSHMDGNILFLALGTGLDIEFFPPNKEITAIDISSAMLSYARPRIENYSGTIEALEMDVHDLSFPDNHFDQIYTSCTFCSVPKPIDGLKALHRVHKPGGELRMFEHTGSRYQPFKLMMDIMTPISGKLGPDMNRDTTSYVGKAGFYIKAIDYIYMDIVKTILAEKPGSAT